MAMTRILVVMLLICGSTVSLTAQNAPPKTLYLTKGRGSVTKVFRPRSSADSDQFFVYIRKFQEVSIKVISNSVFLGEGNECGVYFRIFDDKGVETKIGDSPAGVDDWTGYVDHAGRYKLKIEMGCLEAFTAKQLAAKKPGFTYTLKIVQPLAPSR